jgi:phosphoglycolate phosphatase
MILSDMFGSSKTEIGQFVKEWMGLIESPELLALDTCLPGIHQTLQILEQHSKLHICTARQHRDLAVNQLAQFDLLRYFSRVLVTAQQCSKELLIMQQGPLIDSQDWIVGDTGKDIAAGRFLKINTCAVLSGFQSKATLLEYGPDLVLESVANFSPIHLITNRERASERSEL